MVHRESPGRLRERATKATKRVRDVESIALVRRASASTIGPLSIHISSITSPVKASANWACVGRPMISNQFARP